MSEIITANPNGANGYTSDPREQVCWDLYVESVNKGQPNAYQAAIDAKYSEDHSRNITLQGWFKERLEKLKRKDMLTKAEKVLEKTLDYDPNNGGNKIDNGLLKTQTDVAKFIASTQGKEEGYGNTPAVNDNNVIMIVLGK